MKVGYNIIGAKLQEGILKNGSAQQRNLDSKEVLNKMEKIESENVSNNKITRIKNEINNGSYKIDLEQTSNKMARDLLNL